MPDKKLTDTEIKKALEFPRGTEIANFIIKNPLDLINRLQAEKEQYKANSDSRQTNEYKNIDIAHIKAQAYKECIKKVRSYIKTNCNPYSKPILDYDTSLKIMHFIDNLLKELVGDTDA